MCGDTIIYKYRDWNNSNHRKILTKFELFFASPKSFNDPFDTKVFFDIENMPNLDYLEFNRRLSHMVGCSLKELDRKIISRKEISKISEKVERDYMDDYIGIVSFSKSVDNILLWSHYANYHTGFAVGFDSEKLKEIDSSIVGREITYSEHDSFPFTSPIDENRDELFLTKVFSKSSDWKYESEYRLVKEYHDKTSLYDPRRKVQFNPEIIQEVCLGMEIEQSHKEIIKNTCKDLNIPIFQMKGVPGRYKVKKTLCI